jgi:hypothetical protein
VELGARVDTDLLSLAADGLAHAELDSRMEDLLP